MTPRRERPSVTVVVLAAAGLLFLALPVAGLLWRAPWSSAWDHVTSPSAGTALRVSLLVSTGATVLAAVLGLPLAWLLARHDFRGRRLVRAAALVPLVLPPVVGGVALLLAFGRRGLAGRLLADWFGVTLPFTAAGAAVAGAFVALPFLVLTAEAGFRAVDRELEDAARTLGAGRWTAFRRVTLPLAAPSLVAGLVLGWARALGEFGATITFAGNSPGRTTTVPLEVFLALQAGDAGAAVTLSLVLLVVSVAVLVLLRDRWLPRP